MAGHNRINMLNRAGLLNDLETMQDISHNPDYHEPRGFCKNEACRPLGTVKWYSVGRGGRVKFITADTKIDKCDWCGYYLFWSKNYQRMK